MPRRAERRNLAARADRDRVASLLNLQPRQVAVLSMEQADAMADHLQRQAADPPRRPDALRA